MKAETKAVGPGPTVTGYTGFECGCRLQLGAALRADQEVDTAYYIEHCPVHAVARNLLDTAAAAIEEIEGPDYGGSISERTLNDLKDLIQRAKEGR